MKEKLSLLTELIKLARVDNELREKEYDFLLSVASSLNVAREEFDALFDEYIEFTPEKSEFDRILQFHRLVLLMNIDKETSEKELIHLKNIGIRIGLNPNATNKVLEVMNNYPNKVIPADTLIEIFKENYN